METNGKKTLSKTILFLLARTDSAQNAEAYMRNRDWSIKVSSNLKEAIVYLFQNRPTYFFISYDFPNKRILALIKSPVLTPLSKAILTGEFSKAQTLKGIQDFNYKYKLAPPISGPAIERLINKIQKEDEEEILAKNLEAEIRSSGQSNQKEKIIKIKSNSNPQSQEPAIVQSGVGIGDLLRAIEGDEKSAQLIGLSEIDTTSKNETDQNDLSQNNIYRDPPQESTESDSNSPQFKNELEQMKDVFKKAAEAHNKSKNKNSTEMSMADLAHFSQLDLKKSLAQMQKTSGAEIDSNLTENIFRNFETLKKKEIERRQRTKQSINYPGVQDQDSHSINENINAEIPNSKITVLEKSTEAAVDLIFSNNFKKNKPSQIATYTSNVICMFVESQNFKGYLIAAFSKSRNVDNILIDQLKSKLIEHLELNGEKPKNITNFDLRLQEVEFEDWSAEHADFLKNSSHHGNKISIAFFPLKQEFNDLSENLKLKKYSVSLDELRGDVIVDFDLHIHLEKNEKSIVYTAKGGVFYSNQKDRLQTHGISKLFIDPKSKNDLKKYRVQTYLNDKILQFKSKSKKASGSNGGR